ncbi:hypothetical protein AB4Z54_08885 [Streptomyces sp. MCAF7]
MPGAPETAYAAPHLIGHYVVDHGYPTPWEFIDVVLAFGLQARHAPCAADLQEPHHRPVEVEGQAGRAAGDDLTHGRVDEGLAVAGDAAGGVVVAVLGEKSPIISCRPSPAGNVVRAGGVSWATRPGQASPQDR